MRLLQGSFSAPKVPRNNGRSADVVAVPRRRWKRARETRSWRIRFSIHTVSPLGRQRRKCKPISAQRHPRSPNHGAPIQASDASHRRTGEPQRSTLAKLQNRLATKFDHDHRFTADPVGHRSVLLRLPECRAPGLPIAKRIARWRPGDVRFFPRRSNHFGCSELDAKSPHRRGLSHFEPTW